MKTCIQIGRLALALGLAAFLAGCVSQSSAYRRQPAHDFEVVETSTKRVLTTRELAHLRAKVADYLAQQGETGSGDYYVKIYLGEEEGVERGEWVVVRFTRYPSAPLTVVDAYPTTSYPSYLHYNYDYLPFGWFGFSALSFHYFDDPYYYGSPGYYPRWSHPRYTSHWRDRDRKHDHRHDHDRDHDRDRDRKKDRDKDRHWDRDRPRHDYGNRPSGALKPSFVPSHADRTRWSNRDHDSDNNRRSFDRRRRDNREDRENRHLSPTRSENRPRWRDRQADNRPNQTGAPAATNNFNPSSTPSPTVTAPPARPFNRPDFSRQRGTSEPGRISRPQNTTGQRIYGGRDRSPTSGSSSAQGSIRPNRSSDSPRSQPAYNPPAPRTESRAESRSDNSSRTNINDGGRRAREP